MQIISRDAKLYREASRMREPSATESVRCPQPSFCVAVTDAFFVCNGLHFPHNRQCDFAGHNAFCRVKRYACVGCRDGRHGVHNGIISFQSILPGFQFEPICCGNLPAEKLPTSFGRPQLSACILMWMFCGPGCFSSVCFLIHAEFSSLTWQMLGCGRAGGPA